MTSVQIEGTDFVVDQAVQLGRITALWGVNDAGKSTTLNALSTLLGDGNAQRARISAISLEVDEEEADELAVRAIDELVEGGNVQLEQSWGDAFSKLGDLPDDLATEVAGAEGSGDALRVWVRVALHASGVDLKPASDGFVDAIIAQRRLCLIGDAAGAEWTIWWGCESTSLHDIPSEALQALAISVPRGTARPVVPVLPAAVARVGTTGWPTPVRAPVEWASVEQHIADASTSIVEVALKHAEDQGLPYLDPEDAAEGAMAALASRAEGRMPEFISRNYTLSAKRESRGLSVVARRRDGHTAFPIADLAEGFHLWVQLALLSIADLACRCAVGHFEADEFDSLRTKLEATFYAAVDPEAEPEDLEAFAQGVEILGTQLLAMPGAVVRESLAGLINPGTRFFLVDEPEAHLHPAAQREAASWLEAQDEQQAGRFVIASHSPAFLRLSSGVSLVHVSRTSNRSVQLRSIGPGELGAIDPEIAEVGFDRGELLALFRAVLFVEGETDRRVLEVLFSDLIAEIGLLVQPFRGATKVERIVEAETLLRVLGPPFHVLVDNCDPTFADELQRQDADELDRRLLAKEITGDEPRFLARLLVSGRRAGQELRVHSIPQKDILGALDDECIRAVLQRRAPTAEEWPGLAEVVKRHAIHYSSQLKRYGIIKDADLFAQFATEMRVRGLSAPELAQVLNVIHAELNGS